MRGAVLTVLIVLNVLWAGTYSATKILMAKAPFFTVTSLRYLIAALPLLVFAAARVGLRMRPRDFAACALMGIATFTACPAAMYAGVNIARASDAAILTSAEPLLAALGAYLFLRERMSGPIVLGLLTAFAGALMLSEFWKTGGTVNPAGTALIVLGVFFEAMYSVIGKSLLAREEPLKITAVALGAACVANVGILAVTGDWRGAAALDGLDWWLLAVYLAGVCTVFGYTFWFVALRQDAVANVAITIFIQPIAGMAIAWLWVSETPTATQVAGAACVLAAVATTLFTKPKPAPPPTG